MGNKIRLRAKPDDAGASATGAAGDSAATKDARPGLARRGRRLWHLSSWAMGILSGSLVLVAVLVVALRDQTLTAPGLLRDQISARIGRTIAPLSLTFGDLQFRFADGWQPRVRLRDVVLTDADGRRIVALSEVEAHVGLEPLLQGRIQPTEVFLNGAFADIHRDINGAVTLSLGDNTQPMGQAPTVPQMLEEMDRVWQNPFLSGLRRFEANALILRYEDARQARAWTLDNGHVQIVNTGQQVQATGNFALLTGRDYATSVELNYASRIGEISAEFGVSVQDIAAQDIAAQSAALAWLDVLRAPISGALRSGVDAEGKFRPLSATLQIGEGVLQPNDQARPIPFTGARSYFNYYPASQQLVFDELSVTSSWVTGLAEGRAVLNGVNEGKLTDLVGQLTLSGLTLNPMALYPQPLTLGGASADFRLQFNPFRMTLGEMLITDQESALTLSGDLDAGPQGWSVAVDGRMNDMTVGRLVELWPDLAAPKPRKWVVENLAEGKLRNLAVALRARPGARPDIFAGFDFEDTSIRFLKTMPLITGAAGQASLNGGRFVVTATDGVILPDEGGALDISGTSFIIPDVGIRKAAPGVVRAVGTGSVAAILSLLNRPPLAILKGTPLPVALAEGQVSATGTLSLPLKKGAQFDEMAFHADGRITNVSSRVLVPGYVVTAAELAVETTQDHVSISGNGAIAAAGKDGDADAPGPVPARVEWTQKLGKGVAKTSRLQGSFDLSQSVVDTFRIGLPKGTVTGQGIGQFSVDLAPGEPPALNVTSDLQGVGLHMPPLGWSKPANSTGLLQLGGVLGNVPRIDKLVLQAAGLSATGSVLNREGGGLNKALFSSVKLGGWLDANVELIGRGSDPPDIRLISGTLDMRRATFGSSGGGSGSGPSSALQVSLGRLQVTDSLALTNFTGQFSTTGGLSGPFQGQLNGAAAVQGQVEPKNGRSAFRMTSADAGAVVRAAGLLSQVHGGALDLTLQPVAGTAGDYDGVLRITNTRIKDGPAMVALLNAISVVGLLDEMAGQGLMFTEVDGQFRLSPSQVTLHQGSAVGPSVGLSMDGIYQFAGSQLKMQGVVSPLFLLNGIGTLLARKGEGVIGFNYTLSGAASAPSVQVNPLSALTPGLMRDMFREAPAPDARYQETLPTQPAPSLPVQQRFQGGDR